MKETDDYRLYLKEKFDGIHVLMNARFENVEDKLDGILVEAKRTNSRVTHLEDDVNALNKKLILHPVECSKAKEIDALKEDLIEYKFIKKYPKASAGLFLVFLAGFALSVISVIQNFKTNTKSDTILKQTELVEEGIK